MDWDQRYQQGDIPWDLGRPHPLWSEFLLSERISGAVGVPACGRGHDVYAAATAGYEAWGWDISSVALEWAKNRYSHRRAHFIKRDMHRLYDDWEGKFAVIWEWNCLCVFPPEERKGYLRMLLHMLEPNGVLTGVFRIRDGEREEPDSPPWWIDEESLEELLTPFFRLVDSQPLEQEENGYLCWRRYRSSI